MSVSPTREVTEHQASSAADLAHDLAAYLATALRQAIASRGHALLAVSGGKSPIALFEQLRSLPLDWARVTVLLVDERCVTPDHPDSNAALVRQHLLQGQAAAATMVTGFDALPEILNAATLETLIHTANLRLSQLPWPIDVAVLGMGEDGHTASLFPGAPGLADALAGTGPLAWVIPATAPHARLTLTLPALLSARELVLSISGEAKLAVYRQARLKADPVLPVSLVLHQQQTPVSVWKS